MANSKADIIQPRTLRGFRDFLPEMMMPRERIMEIARGVYRSFGFSPIDTPALEYLEILAGKGGDETDKQMYRFEDAGGRKVGMRFDLTVPLARFAAQHIGQLGTPFKRYHIATVWRGEKSQRGRFREFMQCDFDTIGTRSLVSDAETGLVIYDLLRQLGFEAFSIHVNNRQVLAGLLEKVGLADQGAPLLRALDKLAKIGPEKVAEEMRQTAGASAAQTKEILALAKIRGENEAVLSQVERLVAGSERGGEGIARLRDLLKAVRAGGVPEKCIQLDVSIARGLDYYTGVVYETFLDALPGIGSICSGGRYDDLAGLYTRQELPGIGASLGMDRLLAAMEELGMIEKVRTPAEVFLPLFAEERLCDYLALAAKLRAAGLGVEFFPECKKLGQQLKYADQRGFRVAVIVGEDEWAGKRCQVKDLRERASADVPLEDEAHALIEHLQSLLGVES